ncbi:hypothetical protein KKG08_01115 [Patescibacteria group bacterium]|nr:hypothetical protein [Patescibacteria group bacterium]
MIIQKVYAAVSPIFEFSGITTINDLITWITNLLIILGFGLVVVFLALGFIRFITSQGDKEATAQAQKWVSYSALGGIGLLAVYTIRAIILNVTGADLPGEGGN